MPAYPNIMLTDGSSATPDAGIKVDRSSNAVKSRRLYDSTLYEVTLAHEFATTAEADSLLTFYDTNRDAVDITFSLRGVDYIGQFTNEPVILPVSGGWVNIRSSLIAKRAI